MPKPDDHLLVVLKLVGETCNINCHYCYERRKPYERSQYLRPDLLAKLLAACGSRPLAIQLHGGEPLLMKQSRLAELFAVLRNYPGRLLMAVQTNGTLLDDSWLDFFAAEWPDIEIGISLDGDEQGNVHRVDFHDRPIYDKVVDALRLASERQRPVGVIVVATRRVLGRAPEVFENLRQFSAVRAVKLSPCFDFNVVTKPYKTPNQRSLRVLNPTGRGIPGWATTPTEYAQFAMEAFDYWRDSGAFRQFAVEPFVSVIRTLAGLPTGFESFSDRKATFVVTLYPDGRIGSTDEVDLPFSQIGHVDRLSSIDELLTLRHNKPLLGRFERLMAKCDGCSHTDTCRGGMLAERMPYENTPYEVEYCDSRKAVIDHVAAAIGPASVGQPADAGSS